MDCFQIISPFLIAQLTIVFRFFCGRNSAEEQNEIPIPAWVVKCLPLLMLGVLVLTVVTMEIANTGRATLYNRCCQYSAGWLHPAQGALRGGCPTGHRRVNKQPGFRLATVLSRSQARAGFPHVPRAGDLSDSTDRKSSSRLRSLQGIHSTLV
jgi:hypothetical protein